MTKQRREDETAATAVADGEFVDQLAASSRLNLVEQLSLMLNSHMDFFFLHTSTTEAAKFSVDEFSGLHLDAMNAKIALCNTSKQSTTTKITTTKTA